MNANDPKKNQPLGTPQDERAPQDENPMAMPAQKGKKNSKILNDMVKRKKRQGK